MFGLEAGRVLFEEVQWVCRGLRCGNVAKSVVDECHDVGGARHSYRTLRRVPGLVQTRLRHVYHAGSRNPEDAVGGDGERFTFAFA